MRSLSAIDVACLYMCSQCDTAQMYCLTMREGGGMSVHEHLLAIHAAPAFRKASVGSLGNAGTSKRAAAGYVSAVYRIAKHRRM